MRKLLTFTFLITALFAKDLATYNISNLLLLNNNRLSSGTYYINSSHSINNFSLGRDFNLTNNFETSLSLSYLQEHNLQAKKSLFALKSSLSYLQNITSNSSYKVGLSTLFLSDKKHTNITSPYLQLRYQLNNAFNPYLEATLQYNYFNLPNKTAAYNSFSSTLEAGFQRKILQTYTNLPITAKPFFQVATYSHKLKKDTQFSQLYTAGVEVEYKIGTFFDKKSLWHSSKIGFSMQKTLSDSKFNGYNLGLKASLFDF